MSIKDHPRLCGEKFKIAFVIFARSGSPPPMRGKETKKHIEFHVNRITPAYAGKSALHSSSGSGGLDHPRLCGEKLLGDCEPAADRGSPPPMRGKEDGMKIRVDLDGITPAYAGKSRRVAPNSITNRDHPRLCGEKDRSYMQVSSGAGSPPPMRGKAPYGFRFCHVVRITPAYAGKSRP